jgi:hypothetical protein
MSSIPALFIEQNIGVEVLTGQEPSAYADINIGIEVITGTEVSSYAALNVGISRTGTEPSIYSDVTVGDYASIHDGGNTLGPEFAFAPSLRLLTPNFGQDGQLIRASGVGFGDECAFVRWAGADTGNFTMGEAAVTSTASPWSVEGWFRSATSGVFGVGQGVVNGSLIQLLAYPTVKYAITLHDGKVRFDDGAGHGDETFTRYDDGDWHHVRLVYDGTHVHMSVDGLPKFSFAIANTAWNRIRLAPSTPLDLREWRVQTNALLTGVFTPDWNPTPDASTFALWHINDNGGTTIADSSGNARDLTISGDDFRWIDWDFALEITLNGHTQGLASGDVRARRADWTVAVASTSGPVIVRHTRVHADASSAVAFTILPPEPERGQGFEVRVYDKDNFSMLLAIFENAYATSFNREQNAVGAGSFKLSLNDPKATPANLAHGNMIRVFLDGIDRFAFLIENVQEGLVDATDASSREATIQGAGLLEGLKGMLVYPPNWPSSVPPKWEFGASDKVIDYPSDIVAGDLALLVITRNAATETNDVSVNDAGWTPIFKQPVSTPTALLLDHVRTDAFWKVVAAGETSVSVHFVGGKNYVATVHRITSADTQGSTIIAHSFDEVPAGGPWTAKSINTTTVPSLTIGVFATDNLGAPTTWAAPAAFAVASDDQEGAGADGVSQLVVYKVHLPGETGTRTAIPTDLADRGQCGLIAIAESKSVQSVVTVTPIDSGDQTIDVVAAAKTYTRHEGSYLDDGFAPGDTVHFTGFLHAGNSGAHTISTVTALVITVSSSSGLLDESGSGNEHAIRLGVATPAGSIAWVSHKTTRGALAGEGNTAGFIMSRLLNAGIARGVMPTLTYDFTDAVDSLGVAWPENFTIDYVAGMTVQRVLDQFTAVGYDCEITSDLVLHFYVTQTIDRSVGDTPTIFAAGDNLAIQKRSAVSGEVANTALVRHQGDYAESNVASPFPRREIYVDARQADAVTAGVLASHTLDNVSAPDDAFTGVVTSLKGHYEAFVDWNLGDKVLVDIPGFLDRQAFRIRTITCEQTDSGYVKFTLAFNSQRHEYLARLKRMLKEMTGGGLSGSGGGGLHNTAGSPSMLQNTVDGGGGSGAGAVSLSPDLANTLLSDTGGELDLNEQNAHMVLAGPQTGSAAKPSFRALLPGDVPPAILAHDMFSPTHLDTVGETAPVEGDVMVANSTPAWDILHRSVPSDAAVRHVLGIDHGDTGPLWKIALSNDDPVTQGYSDSPDPGTSLLFAHLDHRHGMPAVLGTEDIRAVYMTFGQAMMVGPVNQGAGLNGNSLYAFNHYSNPSGTTASDADGIWLVLRTTGNAGNEVGFDITNDAGSPVHTRQLSFQMLIKIKHGSGVSNLRSWAGASGDSSVMGHVNQVGADSPTGVGGVGNYVGVGYSNGGGGRNDSTFQFQVRDGTTITQVDSGVTVTTNAFYVLITANESVPSFNIKLYDHTGAFLAQHTFTANLPAAGALLSPCVAVWNMVTGSFRDIWFAYARGVNQI